MSSSAALAAPAAARLSRLREYTRLLAREKPDFSYWLGDLAVLFGQGRWARLEASRVREAWLAFASGCESAGRWPVVNFYASVPYCPNQCAFCMFFDEIAASPELLQRYCEQMAGLGDWFREVLERVPISNGYLGGGSPSLFNERQLETVCAAVFRRARLDPDGEHTVEINPASTTAGKLKILRESGFNRVSFGVQSLDPGVLKTIGRTYQTPELTLRTVRLAWEQNFKEVNADLLCGVHRGRAEVFLDSFRRVAEMGPSMITVYVNEPTYEYVHQQYQGDRALFEGHLRAETRALEQACDWARERGWEVMGNARSGVELIKGGRVFKKEGHHFELQSPGQAMFSLGRNSVSYLPSGLRYKHVSMEEDPAKTPFEGREFAPADVRKLYALEKFYQGLPASPEAMGRLFETTLEEGLGEALAPLRELGLLEDSADGVRLRGEDRAERYAAGMLFYEHELVASRVSDMFDQEPIILELAGARYELRPRYGPLGGPRLILPEPAREPEGSAAARLLESCRALLAQIESEGLDLLEARQALFERLGALCEKLRAKSGAAVSVSWKRPAATQHHG